MIQRISNTVNKFLRPTIWVIEDNEITSEVVRRKIEKTFKNVRVVEIRNGSEALNKISSISSGLLKCPMVVVIDRNLPGINGEQIGVLVKQACPKINTILYSGDANEAFASAEKRAFGFSEVVSKSSSPETLTNIISGFIENHA